MDWLQSNYTYLLLSHGFATFFMCGLCWFVQLIHYPLFRQINLTDLSEYEWKNLRTAIIAVPLMSVELLTGVLLLWLDFHGLMLVNMGLFLLIALSTIVFQGPFHLRLIHAPKPALIEKLILTNWIRTWAWTLRSGIILYLLSSAL